MCNATPNVDSNSFYYFFSATPQVLAAILGLFGVFIVFKIDSLKKQMFGIGQSLLDKLKKDSDGYLSGDKKVAEITGIETAVKFGSFVLNLENAIVRLDADSLKTQLESITAQNYGFYSRNYNSLYNWRTSLINSSKRLSIVTLITIFICLLMIPFGPWFYSHGVLLSIVFIIFLVAVGLIFVGLYRFIESSLKDPLLSKKPRHPTPK
jgi:hypothetical protein